MNLCLGTVQFGMDYGIAGKKKPGLGDALSCLDYATQNGVRAIDTARAYGTAEEVVGEFLKKKTIPRDKLFISTKLMPNIMDDMDPAQYFGFVEKELREQLSVLHTDYVDAYMYHSARYAFDDAKLEALSRMKEIGLAKKVGVSVYEPDEAMACFQNLYVDVIQVPYSIFDHRMKNGSVFEEKNRGNCEIHSRSAFIQGLIAIEESDVPPFLSAAKPIIRKIDRLCKDGGMDRVHLALQYVKREAAISHLVFGVDSLDQLKEDIELFDKPIDSNLMQAIEKEFDHISADIVMPSLWKR